MAPGLSRTVMLCVQRGRSNSPTSPNTQMMFSRFGSSFIHPGISSSLIIHNAHVLISSPHDTVSHSGFAPIQITLVTLHLFQHHNSTRILYIKYDLLASNGRLQSFQTFAPYPDLFLSCIFLQGYDAVNHNLVVGAVRIHSLHCVRSIITCNAFDPIDGGDGGHLQSRQHAYPGIEHSLAHEYPRTLLQWRAMVLSV